MLFLDQDPVMCAQSTPISLYESILPPLRTAIEQIRKVYNTRNIKCKVISSPTDLEELVLNDIGFSKRNRDWYINYYNALAMNYNKLDKTQYPALQCMYAPRLDTGAYFSNPLKIHQPTYDKAYFDLVNTHGDFYKGLDSLDTSRAMLIHLSPTPDEFMFGEPAWLSNNTYQDYSAYDPINKIHIKIVRGPKQYRYFTSKISNNWKEVANVPKEIDAIIDCILINKV